MIQGIKITELDIVKAQIMVTASLRNDYDGCVPLYKAFVYQKKMVSPPELNILRLDSSNHKGGGKKKRRDGSGGFIENDYYSKE